MENLELIGGIIIVLVTLFFVYILIQYKKRK